MLSRGPMAQLPGKHYPLLLSNDTGSKLGGKRERERGMSGHGEPVEPGTRATRAHSCDLVDSYTHRRRRRFGDQIPRRPPQPPPRLRRPLSLRYPLTPDFSSLCLVPEKMNKRKENECHFHQLEIVCFTI